MKRCPACERTFETVNTLCPVDGTVLEKTDDELVGQVLANKYRIEEYINAGGMASVYRATHVLMEKRVAVKVLHSSLAADGTIVERFKREARAASRISHPHALNVTDFGETDDGVVYLVMEYLDGVTLKELIVNESPLSLERIGNITRQVCGALDAAHAEGVVHRDLKSDNIMLIAFGGVQDFVKVLDFGIAKIQEPIGQDAALTAPNIVIGTPHYMSPEQCEQSTEIDFRSDIYSFGVILYEMLTGGLPFTGDSPTAIMMKQIQEPAPSILDVRADLPPSLARVVAKALEKKPEDRFESTGALAVAFHQALTDAHHSTATPAQHATNSHSTPTNAYHVGEATLVAAAAPTAEFAADPTLINNTNELTPADKARLAYSNAQLQTVAPPNRQRWVLPAVLVVVALGFGGYLFTRQPASNDNTNSNLAQPLNADPQAQAAQPLNAPTGASEQGAEVINDANANVTTVPVTPSGGAAPSINNIPFTYVPFPEDVNLNSNGDASVITTTGGNTNTANRNTNANTSGNVAESNSNTAAPRSTETNTNTRTPAPPEVAPRPSPNASATPRPTPPPPRPAPSPAAAAETPPQ